MRDYLTLGTTPYEEDCVQVITGEAYHEMMKKEAAVYRDYLMRLFPEPPKDTYFSFMMFSHDFGTYWEVVCWYDAEDETALDFSFEVENTLPAKWDEEARKELDEIDGYWSYLNIQHSYRSPQYK